MNDNILVVMPCYNAEDTIVEAINSVLSQTYTSFTLVCIDDCSTDNTLQKLKQLRNVYTFDIIESAQNQGTGNAVNAAISHYDLSKFTYITWISADNILNNEFLASLYNKIKSDNSDICYGSWNSFKGKDKQRVSPIQNPNTNINHLKQTYNLGPAFLFTRELWNTIGPFHNLPGEDYFFAVKAAILKAKFSYVLNIPLVSYRIHDNSVSGRIKAGQITDIISHQAHHQAQLI